MKQFIIKFILFQIVLIILSVNAQNQSTLPTYHWAYPYLHQLRVSGYFKELSTIMQPYTRAQVCYSLAILQRQIQQGEVKPSAQEQWLIQLLRNELQTTKPASDGENKLNIEPGLWTDESIIYDQNETQFYTQVRSQVGLNLKDKLTFYNGIRLDQSLLDDPAYSGKKWRGYAGYTEQAYVRFTISDLRFTNYELRFTMGRDFLNWGSGKTGRLLFSYYAQPLDLLSLSFHYNGLQFTALAADLDHWRLADSLIKKYHTLKANRYLSAHRLTINLRNKLYIGLAEVLLYGGPNTNWELKYHNPVLYYHGELLNGGSSSGNVFLYLDFDWYPWRNWEFYGEILIDDLQLEKTGPGDLEPNEIGYILGFQRRDCLGLRGSVVGLEYVRIANRTYNSELDWEKFVHFKKPIGYYLGNNLDRWNLSANYWVCQGLQVGTALDYIRQGQGSILDRWDEPWISYSISEGYHESFPYGIIEKSMAANLNLRFHFRANIILESQFNYQYTVNAFNKYGRNEKERSLFFKLHWNLSKNVYY